MSRKYNKKRNNHNINTDNMIPNATVTLEDPIGDGKIYTTAYVDNYGRTVLLPTMDIPDGYSIKEIKINDDNDPYDGYDDEDYQCDCCDDDCCCFDNEEDQRYYDDLMDRVVFPGDEFIDPNLIATRDIENTYDKTIQLAGKVIRDITPGLIDKLNAMHRSELATMMEYITSYSLLLAQNTLDAAKEEVNKNCK